MKFAPTLHEVVILGHLAYPDDEQMARAARELRALLAVATAAATVNREDDDGGGTLMPLEFWRPMKKLSDALHRLARLSRGERGGKGR